MKKMFLGLAVLLLMTASMSQPAEARPLIRGNGNVVNIGGGGAGAGLAFAGANHFHGHAGFHNVNAFRFNTGFRGGYVNNFAFARVYQQPVALDVQAVDYAPRLLPRANFAADVYSGCGGNAAAANYGGYAGGCNQGFARGGGVPLTEETVTENPDGSRTTSRRTFR